MEKAEKLVAEQMVLGFTLEEAVERLVLWHAITKEQARKIYKKAGKAME